MAVRIRNRELSHALPFLLERHNDRHVILQRRARNTSRVEAHPVGIVENGRAAERLNERIDMSTLNRRVSTLLPNGFARWSELVIVRTRHCAARRTLRPSDAKIELGAFNAREGNKAIQLLSIYP